MFVYETICSGGKAPWDVTFLADYKRYVISSVEGCAR